MLKGDVGTQPSAEFHYRFLAANVCFPVVDVYVAEDTSDRYRCEHNFSKRNNISNSGWIFEANINVGVRKNQIKRSRFAGDRREGSSMKIVVAGTIFSSFASRNNEIR